jgi:Spy/CpxP family protein refolding chaperone
MKRILVLTTIVLIVAATAVAGEGPAPRFEERGGAELAHYLGLTAAQNAAWESARAEFNTAIEPLLSKHREIMSGVEASLKSASVDACAVGNQMIAAQAVVDQIRAAKETLTQKQLSVLTPDQKSKYDAFVAARGEGEKMMIRRPL